MAHCLHSQYMSCPRIQKCHWQGCLSRRNYNSLRSSRPAFWPDDRSTHSGPLRHDSGTGVVTLWSLSRFSGYRPISASSLCYSWLVPCNCNTFPRFSTLTNSPSLYLRATLDHCICSLINLNSQDRDNWRSDPDTLPDTDRCGMHRVY